MAITKTLKQPVQTTAQAATATQKTPGVVLYVELDGEVLEITQDDVDRCIQLDAEVAAITEDPRIRELADLKKKIKTVIDAGTAAEAFDRGKMVPLKGASGGRIEASKCSKKREVKNKAALLLAVGESQFIDMANFSLTDIDKYTDADQRKEILFEDDHGGSRSLKIIHTA